MRPQAQAAHTWLVRGDLERRTLESLQDNAECPSLSPDERHVAYKKRDVRDGATWTLAVLDLRSGIETTLGETRSVDDQVEWLDEHTLLYGLPREDEPGTSDVYALDIAEGSDTAPVPQRRRFAGSAPRRTLGPDGSFRRLGSEIRPLTAGCRSRRARAREMCSAARP